MMAQMIMKKPETDGEYGKMFKWDICEKSYEICPEPKRKFYFLYVHYQFGK